MRIYKVVLAAMALIIGVLRLIEGDTLAGVAWLLTALYWCFDAILDDSGDRQGTPTEEYDEWD